MRNLGPIPCLGYHVLCDLGEDFDPLWTSVSSSAKAEQSLELSCSGVPSESPGGRVQSSGSWAPSPRGLLGRAYF